MVAVTYGVGRVGAAEAAPKVAPKAAIADMAAPRKSWFARFFDAMVRGAHAAGPTRNQDAHAFSALQLRRARQSAGRNRNPVTCRSAAGDLRFFTVEAAPALPARGGFVLAAQNQRDPAIERDAPFEHEALRAIDRERRIGVARQQAGQHNARVLRREARAAAPPAASAGRAEYWPGSDRKARRPRWRARLRAGGADEGNRGRRSD